MIKSEFSSEKLNFGGLVFLFMSLTAFQVFINFVMFLVIILTNMTFLIIYHEMSVFGRFT